MAGNFDLNEMAETIIDQAHQLRRASRLIGDLQMQLGNAEGRANELEAKLVAAGITAKKKGRNGVETGQAVVEAPMVADVESHA